MYIGVVASTSNICYDPAQSTPSAVSSVPYTPLLTPA